MVSASTSAPGTLSGCTDCPAEIWKLWMRVPDPNGQNTPESENP